MNSSIVAQPGRVYVGNQVPIDAASGDQWFDTSKNIFISGSLTSHDHISFVDGSEDVGALRGELTDAYETIEQLMDENEQLQARIAELEGGAPSGSGDLSG